MAMNRYANSSSAMIPTMIVPIWSLLEVVAKADVKSAHDKKDDDDSSENQVAHGITPSRFRRSASKVRLHPE
jgi:hypothetical protein